MPGMQPSRLKISVSLPSDLVDRIDQVARAESRSRSRVVESWLRSAATRGAERELEHATIAYYESQTAEESREDAAMAAALSRSARRLEVDGASVLADRPRAAKGAGRRR